MITKRLSPKGRSMRVYFELQSEEVLERASVLGDFNGWDADAHPMAFDEKRGVWRTGISFKPGTAIQFRYLVDGEQWKNDPGADRFVQNTMGSENGVLDLDGSSSG